MEEKYSQEENIHRRKIFIGGKYSQEKNIHKRKVCVREKNIGKAEKYLQETKNIHGGGRYLQKRKYSREENIHRRKKIAEGNINHNGENKTLKKKDRKKIYIYKPRKFSQQLQ